MLDAASRAFAAAAPRRLQIPPEPGKPLLIRLRQDFEWTPNGRSYAYVDPAAAVVVARVDPATHDRAQAVQEKLYPLQAAAVSGTPWRLARTLGGCGLMLLGGLATWSFWFKKHAPVRPAAAQRPLIGPAE